jgi:nitroreductase
VDFYEVVRRRRSVREFQSKPVEEEKLLRVLEAGLKAPSHNHLREWEFILVRDAEERKKVVDLSAKAENITDETELKRATESMADELQKEMYLKALPVQKRMLMSAPELLVVCFRMKKSLKGCKTLYELNNFASIWTCIENILLAMAAEGLYGVTYIPHETMSLKRTLSIPEDYEIAALIPIGYPAPYDVKQKPVILQNKIHMNKW